MIHHFNPPLEQPVADGVSLYIRWAKRSASGVTASVQLWNGSLIHADKLNVDDAQARARYVRIAVDVAPTLDATVLAQKLRDLAAMLPSHLPASQPTANADGHEAISYQATENGLVWRKATSMGSTWVQLTNFVATIVGDVAEDDGAEVRRAFEIEATLVGRSRRFVVPASQFAAMNWVAEHLGAGAIVSPGLGLKDHARAAIQYLSGNVPERRIYAHTGWRELDSGWAFFHAGGAVDANGVVPTVEVSLPAALGRFRFPNPPDRATLQDAVQASLGFLDVAPDPVTVPTYASIWRAILGDVDFSIHLAGPSGAGKSELATLAQQHFGPEMTARRLPASWSSTGNALEGLAFAAKDVLLVVDDFAPTGSPSDVQRLHREADRLLRAQGNNAGRLRMTADANLRPPKPPRCLLLSTGEDIPKGHSIRARTLILEVGPSDVDWARLSACQQDARQGLYAEALVGFVGFLANEYTTAHEKIFAQVDALRKEAAQSATHKRTPEIVANLVVGFHIFLDFAVAIGAITQMDRNGLAERAWTAIGSAARAQRRHQAGSEPAGRFIELLRSAIASGRAHIASIDGGTPVSPSAWGWRQRTIGTGEFTRSEWHAPGRRVGWIHGEDLYLDPDASFAAAQELGNDVGDPLTVAPVTLRKRLRERGVLAAVDTERETLTVRRTCEGQVRPVLFLCANTLYPEAEPDKSDIADDPTSQAKVSDEHPQRTCGEWKLAAGFEEGEF